MAVDRDAECIFCRIVAGEISADVVHDGERVLAFRDINAQAPTHIQIIPKRHVPSITAFEGSTTRDGSSS